MAAVEIAVLKVHCITSMPRPSHPSCRRCLFGRVDHEATRTDLRQHRGRLDQQATERWNFDVRRDQPLVGRYHWTPLVKDIPQSNFGVDSEARADNSSQRTADGVMHRAPGRSRQRSNCGQSGQVTEADEVEATRVNLLRERREADEDLSRLTERLSPNNNNRCVQSATSDDVGLIQPTVARRRQFPGGYTRCSRRRRVLRGRVERKTNRRRQQDRRPQFSRTGAARLTEYFPVVKSSANKKKDKGLAKH